VNDQTVALILGLAIVAVAAVILWRASASESTGRWKVSVGKLFESELEIGPDQRREAQENIVRAYSAHDLPPAPTAPPELPSTIRLRRILWVDDKPDQNLYETLALERLGLAITKATSSHAAFSYLAAQNYSVVITDLGRPGDTCAGPDFVRELNKRFPRVQVVVYTFGAAIPVDELSRSGASAVVTTPQDLLVAVVQELR
jgi:CheY-like chemotaxis protein